MNESIKRSGVAAALLLTASLTMFPATGAMAATAAPAAPAGTVNYVALGDSYAAGQGLATPTGQPTPGCNQTAEDYPHQVAAKLGYALTDVTCSGAVTENISKTAQSVKDGSDPAQADPAQADPAEADPAGADPAQTDPAPSDPAPSDPAPSAPAQIVPIQMSALSASTNVVTVTVGGNDAGFGAVMRSCVATSADGPVAGKGLEFKHNSCKEKYVKKGVDTLSENIKDKVARHLASTYKAIKKAAPNAKIFVVGYPTLFPDAANTPAAGCFTPLSTEPSSVSFTATDLAYLHSVELQLNQTVAEQAAAAGLSYVDNLPASASHSMCPQGPSSYVNGVVLNTGDTGPLVGIASLHPNLAGATFLASQTLDAIAAARP